MMDHSRLDHRMRVRCFNRGTGINVPADAKLPQLPLIVDPMTMKRRLQAHLSLSSQERQPYVVHGCDIIQIRYKPQASCMVSYRLTIENTVTGETGEQVVCGRAFPDGQSATHRDKANARPLVQPRFGPPLIHLSDLEMVLWSFPNDRKIHNLPSALETAHSTPAFFPDWLVSHLGIEWDIGTTTSHIMHYVGEHTCTVRTSVELVQPSQNVRRTITLFAKTYYDGEGAHTDRVMRQLWESEVRRSGRLKIAQPLAYDERLKTLWQLGLHGTTLEASNTESQRFSHVLGEAASTVAALHSTPLAHVRLITMADLLEQLDRVTSMLVRCRPSCQPVLAPLATRLKAQGQLIPASPLATLHGDLHLKNLFLTDGDVALIDLDNVCAGPPGLDLGSFFAGLHTWGMTNHVPPSQITRHARTFLAAYNQQAPWKIEEAVVAWFTALTLVIERAYRSVTRLKDSQAGMLIPLLYLADAISMTHALAPTNGRSIRSRRKRLS
ncbi:MAG: aminoglycoside phosphotransferase family protein [Nitrospira sp.]